MPICTLRRALLQGFRLLGGSSLTHLGPEDLAANAGEDLADTARLLSHAVDCILVGKTAVYFVDNHGERIVAKPSICAEDSPVHQ